MPDRAWRRPGGGSRRALKPIIPAIHGASRRPRGHLSKIRARVRLLLEHSEYGVVLRGPHWNGVPESRTGLCTFDDNKWQPLAGFHTSVDYYQS
jgi:hypothetical protein